jgi:hypothetical protein
MACNSRGQSVHLRKEYYPVVFIAGAVKHLPYLISEGDNTSLTFEWLFEQADDCTGPGRLIK